LLKSSSDAFFFLERQGVNACRELAKITGGNIQRFVGEEVLIEKRRSPAISRVSDVRLTVLISSHKEL